MVWRRKVDLVNVVCLVVLALEAVYWDIGTLVFRVFGYWDIGFPSARILGYWPHSFVSGE